MKSRIRLAFAAACLFTLVPALAHAQDFKKQVIYQIVTDRFYNGDTSNDNPSQSSGLFDSTQTNWNLYWGGDLVGIQAKLSYLHGMGVTALWISPPMDNINVNIPDGSGNPTAPYHGYSAHDFMRIEEHFGDVNNTWTAFDNLVTAAHNLGMKIIVDFPVNDSNPSTAGEDGALYNNGTLVTNFNTDPNGCTGGTVGGCVYHHTPGIPSCFCDRFQIQYDTLEGLADFNQEDSTTDSYLKSAMQTFQQHGVDAFRIDAVKDLSTLRQNNDAVAYGSHTQRWINNDVYIYERQFYNSVVLVAINKNDSTSYPISGLNTALPAGNYSDYLGGLMGGPSITVGSGSGGNNPVTGFTLNPHTVAVWQVVGSVPAPEVGSIGPTVAQPGVQVTIAGQGFGSSTGSVNFGGTNATINSWSNTSVTFTVPSVSNGVYNVQLKNSSGTAANTIQFTVLTAQLIPVTFTVNNATPTNTGDYIFLVGSTVELGNWGSPTPTFDNSVGPLLDPNYPNWFLNVSVPAGQTIQFKFVKIAANGTVTWENGNNHSYLVPTSGIGSVTVNWQY